MLNDHPCERPCALLPRARMWKCVPGRFAAIRTIIVNVCGSRVRELTPTRSRLSIIVEGGNTCQQCRTTMGIPWSELRTISTLLAFVGFPRIHGAMFSNVAAAHKFFARGRCYVTIHKPIGNYICIFSPLLFLCFFFSALFIPLRACARTRSRYFSFPLSRYKICSNGNSERNTKDKTSALETGEFNLPSRSPRGKKNNRLCCVLVCIISAVQTNCLLEKIILAFLRVFFY